MSAQVATTPEAIEAVERLYEFREPDMVRAFLGKNPDLIDLLVEAAAKIPEFVPADGRIVLDVLWDPEDAEAEEDELFALVPTRLGWDQVRPLMERLDREWLVDAGRFAVGRFNVDVEFSEQCLNGMTSWRSPNGCSTIRGRVGVTERDKSSVRRRRPCGRSVCS